MANGPASQRTHRAMGTVMSHKASGPFAEMGLDAACCEIARIENLLSHFLPDSEISRVNRSAGAKPEPVSSETYGVLSRTRELAQHFEGCFDVTIGPLVVLWRDARAFQCPPDSASIRRALSLVDYHDMALDPSARTGGLRNSGQAVDLGGVGKGLAGDKICEVMKRYGISSAYSNLGGNVVALGAKPDGSPWQIGIQHPRCEGDLIGAVAVVDESVVTSGDYQRFFVDRDGRRHHHILDPMTGHPAHSGLFSVTIVAGESLMADVLSTAIFVAGMEKGLGFLRSCPRVEAILVDASLHVYVTQGLRHRFRAAPGIAVTILD